MSNLMLTRQRPGEDKEIALRRAKTLYPGREVVLEEAGEPSLQAGKGKSQSSSLIDRVADQKTVVFEAINHIRDSWSLGLKAALDARATARKVNKSMSLPGDVRRYRDCKRFTTLAESFIGQAYACGDVKNWQLEKYYNVVSNLDNTAWHRSTTAGITINDVVHINACARMSTGEMSNSEFGESRSLGFEAGSIVHQDKAEADRIAKAAKFPKLRDGLSPAEREAVHGMLKLAGMGQNHLTRLVRGVILSFAAEMKQEDLVLPNDENHMVGVEYTPALVSTIWADKEMTGIWCEFPTRKKYCTILAYLCIGWANLDVPIRVKMLNIPPDGRKANVISLRRPVMNNVSVDAQDIRIALAAYAQSLGCEDILDKAYVLGSMLLMHDKIPAIHLPATLAAADVVRPALGTKHLIDCHKRSWNLREGLVVAKYASDCMGLCVKELMSSAWDHKAEKNVTQALQNLGCGSLHSRNYIYNWLAENIIGPGAGVIFELDPLNKARREVIAEFNDTSILQYWYVNQVKEVGGDSLCGAMLSSTYTTYPSTQMDAASARELGVLRQLGVVTNGPMYKRELRLRRVEVDEDRKEVIDGSVREGKISVVADGLCLDMKPKRETMKKKKWHKEKERVRINSYDDDPFDWTTTSSGGDDSEWYSTASGTESVASKKDADKGDVQYDDDDDQEEELIDDLQGPVDASDKKGKAPVDTGTTPGTSKGRHREKVSKTVHLESDSSAGENDRSDKTEQEKRREIEELRKKYAEDLRRKELEIEQAHAERREAEHKKKAEEEEAEKKADEDKQKSEAPDDHEQEKKRDQDKPDDEGDDHGQKDVKGTTSGTSQLVSSGHTAGEQEYFEVGQFTVPYRMAGSSVAALAPVKASEGLSEDDERCYYVPKELGAKEDEEGGSDMDISPDVTQRMAKTATPPVAANPVLEQLYQQAPGEPGPPEKKDYTEEEKAERRKKKKERHKARKAKEAKERVEKEKADEEATSKHRAVLAKDLSKPGNWFDEVMEEELSDKKKYDERLAELKADMGTEGPDLPHYLQDKVGVEQMGEQAWEDAVLRQVIAAEHAHKATEPIFRDNFQSDEDYLAAMYDINEYVRKSAFWQKYKKNWVRESEFMVTHWKNRKLSSDVVMRCANLMKDIFPQTSLTFAKTGRQDDRMQIIRLSGVLVGLLEMGSVYSGEWDRNHMLIQAWAWNCRKKWLDNKLAQKVSDVIKDIDKFYDDLDDMDKDKWDEWARREFGGTYPIILAKEVRYNLDQEIRICKAGSAVQAICYLTGLPRPLWAYDGNYEGEVEGLEHVGVPITQGLLKRFEKTETAFVPTYRRRKKRLQ
uniref:Coat protein n=1 Tax=Zea mays chrysovirus 1 TaxID=2382121 RepID=A0A8E4IFT6_9VIRU|nr:coat protein [Zea mays chrysovirus 1]